MSTATRTSSNPFSAQAKKSLECGKEISQKGLVWRKRRNGTGTWRYDFVYDGERYKGVIGEDGPITLSHARSILADMRAKILTERMRGKTGRSVVGQRTFEELAEDFLAWSERHHQDCRHNKSRMTKHLLPRFRGQKLADISAAEIERMRSELLDENYKRETVDRVVSLLSGVFVFAKKSEPELDNPTRRLTKLKSQSDEIQPFTFEETELLLNDGTKMYRTITRGLRKGKKIRDEARTLEAKVIIGLALYAGLRASEVLGLEWRHVDWDRNEIRVEQTAQDGELRAQTKSYKARVVPIAPSLKPLLEDLLAHQTKNGRSRGLLLSRDGVKPYHQIQRMFGRIKEQAGVQRDSGYHALRHTFATRAAERGIDLAKLQRLLGHSDIKVTMGYVHVTDQDLHQVAEMLG